MKWIKHFMVDEEGATAVEYAIMAAAIAGVIVTIVVALGVNVQGLFETANSELTESQGS